MAAGNAESVANGVTGVRCMGSCDLFCRFELSFVISKKLRVFNFANPHSGHSASLRSRLPFDDLKTCSQVFANFSIFASLREIVRLDTTESLLPEKNIMKTRVILTLTLIFAATIFQAAFASDIETQRKEMLDRAVTFLRQSQVDDGSFSASPRSGIGPTGVVISGLLEAGVSPDDPMVAKGLAYMQKYVHDDGGVYTTGGMFGNYESCIAISCFANANQMIKESQKLEKGPYDELLANAEKYVRGCQYTEEQGYSPDNVYYGGSGYGVADNQNMRPDLSNTHFLIETLKSLGAAEDDPAIQKAIIFVSRCQNLESEHNTEAFAAKNQDGGFIYHPNDGGNSPAGETPNGGLRSYGSMTYAGLKSMIYAGLDEDDIRVKAAHDWAKKHYDVEANPGLGQAGLYYYYQVLGKTLDALKIDVFQSDDGKEHPWRNDLLNALAARQQENGSWVNENSRWMENDPNLVTGYVLLVLAHCREN